MVITMKKTALFLMVILLMIGACGCGMKAVKNEKNNVTIYLEEKYGKSFTLISEEGSAWPVKTKYYNVKDAGGNIFKVADDEGFFTDNYAAMLFDAALEEEFAEGFSRTGKLYISTISQFFSKSQKFSSQTEYLQACAVVNVVVYTTQEDDYDMIANKIAGLFKGCTVSAMVYCVDSETYGGIEKNHNNVDTLGAEEYWIQNNQVTKQ